MCKMHLQLCEKLAIRCSDKQNMSSIIFLPAEILRKGSGTPPTRGSVKLSIWRECLRKLVL